MAETVYFVAGEASGDNHGAALMRELQSGAQDMRFAGRGGPAMRAIAGAHFVDWIATAAVVGLWDVLKKYGYFRSQFQAVLSDVARAVPDAVVLIDYPGFNLRLARTLRSRFPKLKIIYYISPQVWAWNRGRIMQMGRVLDLMLCIFPFEEGLYNASGLRTVFVGHPLTSVIPSEVEGPRRMVSGTATIATGSLDSARDDRNRDRNLVAILPGSRYREIRNILPVMLRAASKLSAQNPRLRFEIAAASERLATAIDVEIGRGDMRTRLQCKTGNAGELLQTAGAGMIASGTATLEAAIARLPFVLVYRVSWITYLPARMVVKVKFLGMPNVLAGREIVPEFIQHRARGRDIAAAVERLLTDESARRQQLEAFDSVAASIGSGNASANAAREILRELQSTRA